jgi:hypothetical protein
MNIEMRINVDKISFKNSVPIIRIFKERLQFHIRLNCLGYGIKIFEYNRYCSQINTTRRKKKHGTF